VHSCPRTRACSLSLRCVNLLTEHAQPGLSCLQVATLAIPLYSILPAVGEYMIEEVSRYLSAGLWPRSGLCVPRSLRQSR